VVGLSGFVGLRVVLIEAAGVSGEEGQGGYGCRLGAEDETTQAGDLMARIQSYSYFFSCESSLGSDENYGFLHRP
jgi:hypothetical protein